MCYSCIAEYYTYIPKRKRNHFSFPRLQLLNLGKTTWNYAQQDLWSGTSNRERWKAARVGAGEDKESVVHGSHCGTANHVRVTLGGEKLMWGKKSARVRQANPFLCSSIFKQQWILNWRHQEQLWMLFRSIVGTRGGVSSTQRLVFCWETKRLFTLTTAGFTVLDLWLHDLSGALTVAVKFTCCCSSTAHPSPEIVPTKRQHQTFLFRLRPLRRAGIFDYLRSTSPHVNAQIGYLYIRRWLWYVKVSGWPGFPRAGTGHRGEAALRDTGTANKPQCEWTWLQASSVMAPRSTGSVFLPTAPWQVALPQRPATCARARTRSQRFTLKPGSSVSYVYEIDVDSNAALCAEKGFALFLAGDELFIGVHWLTLTLAQLGVNPRSRAGLV